jgi:hypothetical protein
MDGMMVVVEVVDDGGQPRYRRENAGARETSWSRDGVATCIRRKRNTVLMIIRGLLQRTSMIMKLL